MHDPVYRQIAEKIERLRIEWVTRIINTKTFLARLRAIEDEMKNYEEKIAGKSHSERLKETMEYYVKQKTGKEVEFKSAGEYLNTLTSRKAKILPQHEKKLKTEILKDMFRAGIEEDAVKLAEELVSYIKEEFDRIWKGNE